MKGFLSLVVLLAPLTAAAVLPAPGTPGAPDDLRYAGEPARDAQGRIKRSSAVLRQFISVWPCPSTGQRVFPCPGWQVDHVLSLSCGGVDRIENLQWLPAAIKSGPGLLPKDRWERKVYCLPQVRVPMLPAPLPIPQV